MSKYKVVQIEIRFKYMEFNVTLKIVALKNSSGMMCGVEGRDTKQHSNSKMVLNLNIGPESSLGGLVGYCATPQSSKTEAIRMNQRWIESRLGQRYNMDTLNKSPAIYLVQLCVL